jgi:hypothetical protein
MKFMAALTIIYEQRGAVLVILFCKFVQVA